MAGIPTDFKAALPLIVPIVIIMLGAIIQQVRYPDSGAWILVFLGAFMLAVAFAVGRAANR